MERVVGVIVSGDRLLQIMLAAIGALLLFGLNDFNSRLKAVENSVSITQANVEFLRGKAEGPLRPIP